MIQNLLQKFKANVADLKLDQIQQFLDELDHKVIKEHFESFLTV